MLSSHCLRLVVALAAALAVLAADTAVLAEQPFFYYPAYGSSRGKIRYVDGVFRNKQRIRWGNGVTDNGVQVMQDFFAAAGQILPVVLQREAQAPGEQEDIVPREVFEDARRTDEDLQSKAAAILNENRQLAQRLGITSLSTIPATDADKPGPSPTDDFKDWDNTGLPPNPMPK